MENKQELPSLIEFLQIVQLGVLIDYIVIQKKK